MALSVVLTGAGAASIDHMLFARHTGSADESDDDDDDE